MERVNDSTRLELLQRANACFSAFFENFCGASAAGPEEELRALLQLHEAMESVGSLLDGGLQAATARQIREALDCYRQNLIRLRSQLSLMEQSTMASRERLNLRREHLSGARAWCVASRAIS